MPLTAGARFGQYTVVSALGAGGMGEVYRARDNRLERDVALKVLPDAFTADADRVARFDREARTLASLNHPNIGGIHGVEEANGITALVMEYVEGEDLAVRLARGPLPPGDALPIARQIASALEAAHEQGIIHRDLKPANVKVRSDGTVKVLDFGLAKAIEPAGDTGAGGAGRAGRAGTENLTQSPTITSPAMTHAGMILGTAAYMSPEQARGKPLDRRTDIWAFGCVLYEMLTGRHAFAGEDVSDVLASILAREPELKALPASTPAAIRRLLRRCLQKDRADRLRDIGDARLEITEALRPSDPDAIVAAAPAGIRRRERVAWIGAVAALTLIVAAAVLTPRSVPSVAEIRVDLVTPPTSVPQSFALSPDGRTLAYVATAGELRLWLRALETGSSRALQGTEGAANPFWSPDGQAVGFFADEKLKRVELASSSVQTLAAAPGAQGGTWNQDGVILVTSLGNPITSIPIGGGTPVPLSGLVQQGSNFAAHFLPEGRRFLYFVRGDEDVRGVYIGDLDGTANPHRLLTSDTGAVYSKGQLLFVLRGTLFAQPFDPVRIEVSGKPLSVAEQVTGDFLTISASQTGSIAYRVTSGNTTRQFVWFDRSGQELSRVGESVTSTLGQPSLSRDGKQLALYRSTGGSPDIWILDARRGVMSRFTSDRADDVFPVWSPDGDRLAFASNRKGVHDLYQKRIVAGEEELILSSDRAKTPIDWSADGRYLLFDSRDPRGSADIFAVSLNDGKVLPVATTTFDEQRPQFSPDGRWVAYQSNESGRAEIYVQPFPGPGTKALISTAGGGQVRWARDGRELFYIDRRDRLMSVSFRVAANANAPEIGSPVALFTAPLGNAILQGDTRHQYVVAPDGQRFLVAAVKEPPPSPITLILNWKGQN